MPKAHETTEDREEHKGWRGHPSVILCVLRVSRQFNGDNCTGKTVEWVMRLHSCFATMGLVVLSACAPERENYYRGGLRDVADLPATDEAGAYRAALAGSFTVADPGLWILVDSLYLPRTEGLAGGAPIPAERMRAIQALDVVRGRCTVPLQARGRGALVCDAAHPGYAVRFSEPFTVGKDSVQVHLVAEQYATPGGPQAERLRFERAYQVVKRGSSWQAVREGRLPQP